MKYVKDVYLFHDKFGIDQPDTARQIPEDLGDFRLKFLIEELEEYQEHLKSGDLEGQLDSLVDLVYVAIGTALISGLDFDAAWDRVQQANMSKERALPDGSNSKRFSQYDVVKPEGWSPPYLSDLVGPNYRRRSVWIL